MGLYNKIANKLIGDPTKGYEQGQDTTRQYYDKSMELLAPYREFGNGYIDKTNTFMDTYKQGRPTGQNITSLPGYQFRFDQGREALENSAIARGGLMSGNAMKALTEYGQNFASNEYDKEYNRYNQDTQNEFSRLLSLLGIGQSAAGAGAGLTSDTGNMLSKLQVGRGEAELRQGMAQNQVFKDISDSLANWFGGGGKG